MNRSRTDKSAGEVVIIEGRGIGVLVSDTPAGSTGEISVEGIHELPAVSNDVWEMGDTLYWDRVIGRLTHAARDIIVGPAAAAKPAGLAIARVELQFFR